MPIRHLEYTVQLDNGLIIPASAGAGRVLTSDGSGNAVWKTPPLEIIAFAISGAVGNKVYPGHFIKLVTNEKKKLIAARYKLKKGKIKVAIEKGEAEISGGAYKALAVEVAAATTTSSFEFADLDYVSIKTATGEETPEDLAVTLFLESTK